MTGEINFLGAVADDNAERRKGINPLGSFLQGYVSNIPAKEKQYNPLQQQLLQQRIDALAAAQSANLPERSMTVRERQAGIAEDNAATRGQQVEDIGNRYAGLDEATKQHITQGRAAWLAALPPEELYNAAINDLGTTSKVLGTDPAKGKQMLDSIVAKGGLQGLHDFFVKVAFPEKAILPKAGSVPTGAEDIPVSIDMNGVRTVTGPGIPMAVSPGQQLAANQQDKAIAARAEIAANSIEARKKLSVEHGLAGLADNETDALFGPNGAITTGRLDPARVNSRTAKIFAQGELANSGRSDFVALTGNAAINRNVPFRQKAMNAEVLPEIMNNMVEAGKRVNYPDAKFAGVLKEWSLGQINDPDLTEYMTQRNDALMSIASVMRAQGMTDMAHQAEIQASVPTMSPRALDAWLRGQMKSLTPRLKQYNSYSKTGPNAPKSGGGPTTITSDADYNKLPSGTEFIAPDGSHRRKP